MKDDSLSDVYKPRLIYADSNSKCITSDGVELDSVGKQEPDPLLAKHEPALNVYAKQIWNDAIETAAKELDIINDLGGSFLVRKLKK